MSGKKQHFIPQSLLRGFKIPEKDSKAKVVVYTYERGIFISGTDGVGAERNFYSQIDANLEDESLDEKITKFENNIAQTIRYYSTTPLNTKVDSLGAAKFVTHLTIRSDHIRKSISSGFMSLIAGLKSAFSDREKAMAMLGLDGNVPAGPYLDALNAKFDEYSEKLKGFKIDRNDFIKFAFIYTKENFHKFNDDIADLSQGVFSIFDNDKMIKIASEAQRNVLKNDMTPQKWIDRLKIMNWRVIGSEIPLILPDCISVSVNKRGDFSPLMLVNDESSDVILVPVSSNRLLLGVRVYNEMPPLAWNEGLAGCAWDFFVGSERSAEFEALKGAIRVNVEKVMRNLINSSLSEGD